MDRGPRSQRSGLWVHVIHNMLVTDFMTYCPDSISRRGMFRSNRGRRIKDGWLGFKRMKGYLALLILAVDLTTDGPQRSLAAAGGTIEGRWCHSAPRRSRGKEGTPVTKLNDFCSYGSGKRWEHT
jgi:hypothetical protein